MRLPSHFRHPAHVHHVHFSSHIPSPLHAPSRLHAPSVLRTRSALCAVFSWRDLRLALWVPAYLLSYFLLEARPLETYWATQTPADRWIPYCSWAFLPYSLWYGLLVLTGLAALVCDRTAYVRYMRFLSATFFLSILIWIAVPNGQDLRPVSPGGALGPAVAALYRIDTNTNVFPSVHVLGAVGAALAAWDALRSRHRNLWRGTAVLSVLVCLSTVMLKQHSLLDVVGALVLSAVVAWPIYRTRFRQERGYREI